jgi:hypothetical protein
LKVRSADDRTGHLFGLSGILIVGRFGLGG